MLYNYHHQLTKVAKPLFALSARPCFHFEIEVANVSTFPIEVFFPFPVGALKNLHKKIELGQHVKFL